MSTKGPSITNFLLHMTILLGLIMVPCEMDITTILLLWKMCRTGMLALHMPLHMPAASITALSVVMKQSPPASHDPVHPHEASAAGHHRQDCAHHLKRPPGGDPGCAPEHQAPHLPVE